MGVVCGVHGNVFIRTYHDLLLTLCQVVVHRICIDFQILKRGLRGKPTNNQRMNEWMKSNIFTPTTGMHAELASNTYDIAEPRPDPW